MINQDGSVWEAVAGVADAPGFEMAAFWLDMALFARRMWFLDHDLKYAGQITEYTDKANASAKRGMEYRNRFSAAA